MKTDDKLERLLDMVEHPEQYTEEEIKELLDDDECREYYELMVKTDNALAPAVPNRMWKHALRAFERKCDSYVQLAKDGCDFHRYISDNGSAYAAITITRPSSVSSPKQGQRFGRNCDETSRREE
jgi:hypothetical protein